MSTSLNENGINTVIWRDIEPKSLVTLIGKDVVDFVNRMSTNDMRDVGGVFGKQTVITNDKGRIIDVVMLVPSAVSPEEHSYWLLTSEGESIAIVQWLRKYLIADDVTIADTSETHAIIEFSGSESTTCIEQLFTVEIPALSIAQKYSFMFEGSELNCIRVPSISDISYYIVMPISMLQTVRESLLRQADTISFCDKDNYEIRRIEKGMGKYAAEYSQQYNPLEAGLIHAISFKKGCYIGQEVIARLDSYNKVKQRLIGLKIQESVSPADLMRAEILESETVIGSVTSSIISPRFGLISLAYIRNEFWIENREITLRMPNGHIVSAQTSRLPFN